MTHFMAIKDFRWAIHRLTELFDGIYYECSVGIEGYVIQPGHISYLQ